MILSDRDIRSALEAGRIVIEPFSPDAVQPSSVDLHLDRRFRVFRNSRYHRDFDRGRLLPREGNRNGG